MDSGFDGKSREAEADRFFDRKRTNNMAEEFERVRNENIKLLEHIAMLHKDGYTYDQLNRKMLVCELCGKNIKEN